MSAVTSVSAADAGKRGTTVTVQKPGLIAPGHMRPVDSTAIQGGSSEFAGQYYNWYAFFWGLFYNYKFAKVA